MILSLWRPLIRYHRPILLGLSIAVLGNFLALDLGVAVDTEFRDQPWRIQEVKSIDLFLDIEGIEDPVSYIRTRGLWYGSLPPANERDNANSDDNGYRLVATIFKNSIPSAHLIDAQDVLLRVTEGDELSSGLTVHEIKPGQLSLKNHKSGAIVVLDLYSRPDPGADT